MTDLAFPILPAELETDEALADRITLLAGQINAAAVSYTHLTLPTNTVTCGCLWAAYH